MISQAASRNKEKLVTGRVVGGSEVGSMSARAAA